MPADQYSVVAQPSGQYLHKHPDQSLFRTSPGIGTAKGFKCLCSLPEFGATARIRTLNLLITSQALCHLELM